ncbi:MAG: transposase [Clostridium sp.]|nr:transposase [Clostridium sp.]
MANRAYKFRIYPNSEQEVLMKKTFGCCRFVYNRMLSDKIEAYKNTGKMFRTTPAMYKKEFTWLREVDSLALANVQLHLEQAYRRFFDASANQFPKFKSKHRSRKSYTTNMVNGNIRLSDGKLRLPKVGEVRIRKHRSIPDGWKLKSVTVSQESTEKFFAALLFEYPDCESQAAGVPAEDAEILGIDFAMNGMAVFSDGTRADSPGFYRKAQERLSREQRKLSHCARGSRNYVKQKVRLAKAHEKVRNQRKDFQHKLSRRLADRFDAVSVEDLDMKAMSRGLNFGKSVMDDGFGSFRDMLSYKLSDQKKPLIRIGRFYPSSKRCSVCGNIKSELRLDERIYHCTCGNRMDRDVNAAVNIREEGRRIMMAG